MIRCLAWFVLGEVTALVAWHLGHSIGLMF